MFQTYWGWRSNHTWIRQLNLTAYPLLRLTDGKAENDRLVYQITCKIYLFKDARSHQSNPVRSSLEVMILLSSHDSMFPSVSKPNLPFKYHCILCNEIIYVSNKRNKSTAEIRKEFTIPDNILAESLKKTCQKLQTWETMIEELKSYRMIGTCTSWLSNQFW